MLHKKDDLLFSCSQIRNTTCGRFSIPDTFNRLGPLLKIMRIDVTSAYKNNVLVTAGNDQSSA
ncbi:hypothetical protein D3C81_1682280 [compost metagenome]